MKPHQPLQYLGSCTYFFFTHVEIKSVQGFPLLVANLWMCTNVIADTVPLKRSPSSYTQHALGVSQVKWQVSIVLPLTGCLTYTTFLGMLPWANFTAVHNTWDYKRVLPPSSQYPLPLSYFHKPWHTLTPWKKSTTNDQVHMTDYLGILSLTEKKSKLPAAHNSHSLTTLCTPKKKKKESIAKVISVQIYYTCNILSWPVTTTTLKQSTPTSVGLYVPTQVQANLASRS